MKRIGIFLIGLEFGGGTQESKWSLKSLQADTPKANQEYDKAKAKVTQLNECIAAWRLALRDLSGEEPAACADRK